jgi:uncharacterized protein involved in outer membrane biogenesis
MKKFLKVILVLVIVIALVFLSGFIFLSLKGKALVVAQMENILKPKVEIGSIKLNFPDTVEMNQLKIENFLETKQLLIQPSLIAFLSGNVGFSKIVLVEPKITISRDASGEFNFANLLKETEGKSKSVMIGDLVIENGNVDFIDKKIRPEGFVSQIRKLDMKLSNPLSPRFNVSAEIVGADKEKPGSFSAEGWMSLSRKDMDADVKLSNLDGAYFSPYFQSFLSEQKLKSANVNTQVNLNARNNEIDGRCRLNIDNITYEEQQQQAQAFKEISIPGLISSVLGKSQTKTNQITLDLPIKGTLIPLKINLVKITGSIFTEMLKNTISTEPEALPQKIESIGNKFKSIGKDFEKIFKEKTEAPAQ